MRQYWNNNICFNKIIYVISSKYLCSNVGSLNFRYDNNCQYRYMAMDFPSDRTIAGCRYLPV